MTEITQADIDVLRTLEPRKSILNFSADELEATEKWVKKFQDELSEKSPFYRLTMVIGEKMTVRTLSIYLIFIKKMWIFKL